MRQIYTSPAAARPAAKDFSLAAAFCIAAFLLAATRASASPIYHDIDNHFSPQLNLLNDPTNPTLWTYNIVVTSDQTFQNVNLVFPFAYQIDRLPPHTTSQTIYPWNNSARDWENGGNSIAIYGVNSQNLLALMSDTDIPLTDSQQPVSTASPGTILATDSVPMLFLGDFVANVPKSFSFEVLTGPNSIKHQVTGFYVEQTSGTNVPEPGGFALLAGGSLVLLAFAVVRRTKMEFLAKSLRPAARHVKSV